MGRVPAQDTAYAFRDQEFIVNVIARTPDADGFAESVAWARAVAAAIGPDAGTYVNFAGDSDPSMAQASYGPEVSVRFGALDGDPGIRPQYHSQTDSAAPWDEIPDDGLPRHPGPAPAA